MYMPRIFKMCSLNVHYRHTYKKLYFFQNLFYTSSSKLILATSKKKKERKRRKKELAVWLVQFEKKLFTVRLAIGCCSKFLFNYSLIRQISARYFTRNSRNCDETLSLFQLKLMSSMISWEKSARFSLVMLFSSLDATPPFRDVQNT